MQKILILGIGSAQQDAIEYCKDRGMEVIGCSCSGGRGTGLLDAFEDTDIKDIDGVTGIAEKHRVDVIYSVGSDIAMPAVMKASEILGLPHFVSYETALKCHRKDLMRDFLGRSFRGNLKCKIYTCMDDALRHEDFPSMMKPVDSQGQRGCYRVNSADDIKAHFGETLGFSGAGRVIIEEYVSGPEISASVYVCDGKIEAFFFSDRATYEEYPGGIIKEHRLPSTIAEAEREAAVDLIRRTVAALGIENGPCYIQIKLRNGSEPVLIEMSPRLDGCHLWKLIKTYCGIDLLDLTLRHLTGENVFFQIPSADICTSCSLEFIMKEPGTRFYRIGANAGKDDYIHYYYDDGDMVVRKNGHLEKCGYIIHRS